MGAQKRRLFLMIFAGALAALAILFLIVKLAWPSKEYTAIQYIVENLSDYQEQIESWGYQVSVFDPMSSNMSKEDDFALIHYSGQVYEPVLILTDQDGGRWYFYNGFDQYAQETTSIELTLLMGGDEERLKIITQLQLYKANMNQPPLEQNFADPGTRTYYDMVVNLNIDGKSLTTGEDVSTANGIPFTTQYCSNNFEECRHFGGIDPVRANRRANEHIKERFTAEQLLEFYQQGLALQERLINLYECK